MISTFGSFSMAKLGIRSSQQGLQITGNNITNINTNGYTRQRINQVSLYGSTADRYSVSTDVNMGFGSLVTSISQIRDPFLDIRYRNEASNLGFYDEKMGNLEELKNVLDEVMKDGIHTGFEDIRTQLQNLTQHVGAKEHDTLVRSACAKLVSLLNKYSADLTAQKQNALQGFGQNVDEVNDVLKQIQDLNIEIRKSQIHGDNASELLDNRNLLIDRLSEMTRINVSYEKEQVAQGIFVDRLIIKMDAPGQDPATRPTLIDGEFANKLEIAPLDNTTGKPDIGAEDYKINLGGLSNTRGESPLLVQIKREMDALNGLTKSMQNINQSIEKVNTKLNAWTQSLAGSNFKEADFNRTPAVAGQQSEYDKKVKELQDKVAKAQKAYQAKPSDKNLKKEYETAKKNQETFAKLAQQKLQLDKDKTSLQNDFKSRLDALNERLKAQKLTAKATQDKKTGLFSVTVSGGNLTGDKTLIDSAKPNEKPLQFGAEVDPKTGDINAQLDNDTFLTKNKQDVDDAAHKTDKLTDDHWHGILKADLEYLNGKGEFDPKKNDKIRGIAYYQRSLDTLAQSFAKTMNEMNRPLKKGADGKPIPVPGKPGEYQREDADLFEAIDKTKPITASNIKISAGWENGSIKITNSIDPNAGAGDNSNILGMIQALNKDQKFYVLDKDGNQLDKQGRIVENPPKDADNTPVEVFTGSFEGMFTNMNAILGSDMSTTGTLLNTSSIAANDRAVARDNVSSVDLNEEGINLVQYQKSFAAACRVMTTLDEMLDTLLSVKR